jgi:hypothetical protein
MVDSAKILMSSSVEPQRLGLGASDPDISLNWKSAETPLQFSYDRKWYFKCISNPHTTRPLINQLCCTKEHCGDKCSGTTGIRTQDPLFLGRILTTLPRISTMWFTHQKQIQIAQQQASVWGMSEYSDTTCFSSPPRCNPSDDTPPRIHHCRSSGGNSIHLGSARPRCNILQTSVH